MPHRFYKLRHLAFLLLFSCTSSAALATDLPKPWVGTWRFANVDGHPVNEPFYMALYADGTSASWPVPRGWENTRGVSRGKYAVEGNKFLVVLPSGERTPAAPFQVKNDQFIMTIERTHHAVYQRVTKKLEPGRLENGKRAGYLKNPW